MTDMFRSWWMEIRVCCLLQFRSHPLSVTPIPLLLAGWGRRLLHPSLCMRACACSVASHQCKRDPLYLSVTTADTLQWKHSCWNRPAQGGKERVLFEVVWYTGVHGCQQQACSSWTHFILNHNTHHFTHNRVIEFWSFACCVFGAAPPGQQRNYSFGNVFQMKRRMLITLRCFSQTCWSLSAQIYWWLLVSVDKEV